MNLHRFWKEESTVTIQSLAELIILEGKKEVYYFIARSHPANKTRNSPFPCYFTNRKLSVLTGTYYFLLEHTIFILLVQNSTLKVKQKTAKHPRKMETCFRAVSTLSVSQQAMKSMFSRIKLPHPAYLSADLCWDADKFWIWSKCCQVFHSLYQWRGSNSTLVAVLFREITIQGLEVKAQFELHVNGFLSKIKYDSLIPMSSNCCANAIWNSKLPTETTLMWRMR